MNIKESKYLIFLATIGFLFSLFLAKPKSDEINKMLEANGNLWEVIEYKKSHILSNLDQYSPHSGEAKYVFRLSVPLIMKVFNLSVPGMHIVQVILGFLIFILWALILMEFINDKKILITLTLCLSSCYYGKAFNIDSGTAVNTLSYFLILFAIKFRYNPLLLIPSLFLLFFNDERGILAFSIIGLFILFFNRNKIENVRGFLTKPFIYLIGCFIVCLIIRLTLIIVYKMQLPLGDIGFKVYSNQWQYLHLGIFSGITGLIIVFTTQLINEILNKQYIFVFMTIFVLAIFLVGTSIVSDMTKSIAYITPLFLLLIWRMFKSNMDIKTISYSVLAVNILFPTIVVVGDKQFEYYNFIFDIIFKIHSLFV
jgi:hypothetical protein